MPRILLELNVAQAQKLHKMPREIVMYLKEWEDVSKIYYVTRCQNSALRQPWMKIYKFESVEPFKTGKKLFFDFFTIECVCSGNQANFRTVEHET